MADEREDVSRAYRELTRAEPPSPVDAAIQARARQALETHPAPLVAPTGRRSWYFQVAAAAVIVLAVAVTLHLERFEDEPTPVPAAAVLQSKVQAPKVEAPVPQARKEQHPARKPSRDEAKLEAQATDSLAKRRADEPAAAAAPAPAERRLQTFGANAVQSPEQWLERIAALRKDGKQDEADRDLAEFRKRYPDFKIAPEMLEKVERR